jgi:hypothetical protein
VNADGKALKTIYTAGANGSRVEGVVVSSSEAVANNLFLQVQVSGVDYPLLYTDVPAYSGYDGTAPSLGMFNDVNTAFVTKDVSGNYYLDLPPGAVLKARPGTTVESGNAAAPSLNFDGTEAKRIAVVVVAQDY